MANFAEINDKNIVIRVVRVPDNQEHRGQDYLSNDLKLGGTWVQTSYNNTIRHRYAGVGYVYLPEEDVFVETEKPFESWVLNEDYEWTAPVPKPEVEKGMIAEWDEESLSWLSKTAEDL